MSAKPSDSTGVSTQGLKWPAGIQILIPNTNRTLASYSTCPWLRSPSLQKWADETSHPHRGAHWVTWKGSELWKLVISGLIWTQPEITSCTPWRNPFQDLQHPALENTKQPSQLPCLNIKEDALWN
jgi:hypothetical protein